MPDVGSADPARYVPTSYTHTLLDQLATVTDQLGNTWSYGYDLRGRQTQAVASDRGTSTSSYDAAGNLATTMAPLGSDTATVAYTYDALGRRTTTRDDSVTGTVRVQWVYDTMPNGVGKLASATRYSSGRQAHR